jgi:hypothetical protein
LRKHSQEKLNILNDWLIAGLLVLMGILIRTPYLALIPTFSDEIMQTVLALDIRPGALPLIGADPYAGPVFSYILAICLRVFGASPVAPRIVAMVMGALTVGLTYGLARLSGLRWPWATLCGLLMAANPHHILITSHYAGATYILPLFTTAFLVALIQAVKQTSGWWLVAAGALLALALQANPVPVLILPGVILWFLIQRKSSIGLRTRWPYLALVAFALVYSPLIVSNVQTHFAAITGVQARDYVWQPALSLLAYIQNLAQLVLQLFRQLSGVLESKSDMSFLIGIPLVFGVWAIAGLVYAARRGTTLPALAIGAQVLIMPWLSSNYQMISSTRFTIHLTPLIFVAMGVLAADVWAWLCTRSRRFTSSWALKRAASLLLVIFSLWPLVPLFRYYESRVTAGETNAVYLAFMDEFMQRWRGEKVMVSEDLFGFVAVRDMSEYNPTVYLLTTSQVPYEVWPIARLLEHLSIGQEKGRMILLVDNDHLAQVQAQIDLVPWDSPAIQTVKRQKGYGVYTIPDAQQVRKPTFVLTDGASLPSTTRPAQVQFEHQLTITGYDIQSELVAPGDRLVINVYWKAMGTPANEYIGFIHLIGPDGKLVAQDDHELGRGVYRAPVWQTDEIVRERYDLMVPHTAAFGDYVLRAGVYLFPSLQRLAASSSTLPSQDNLITLGQVRIQR